MGAATEIKRRTSEEADVRIRIDTELENRDGYHLNLTRQLYFRACDCAARSNGKRERSDESLHPGVRARWKHGGIIRNRSAWASERGSTQNLIGVIARRIQ